MLNKISKSQKTNVLFHLHEITKVVKFTESRMGVAISRGEKMSCLMGRILVLQRKKFWRSIA